MNSINISDSIKYIGVSTYDIDLFEGQYIVPNGMAYNSYVILDDKIAVMDTADSAVSEQWMSNLKEALNGRTPDYLVVQHLEPDHAGSIQSLLELFPEVTLVGNAKTFVMMGDGEQEEGQIWEAAMWAGHRKLDNLTVIVDNNNLQIDGEIDKVCSPYPIDKKFEAFNFHTIVIDGNDFDQIRAAFKEARETKGMPTAIIAETVKGKGVSFMENEAGWHGKAPSDEEFEIAMKDLEKAGEALCQK